MKISNGFMSSSDGLIITQGVVLKDGVRIEVPEYVQKAYPKIIYTDNSDVYINEYKLDFKTQTFKRNFWTILTCLFS